MTDDELSNEIKALLQRSGRSDVQIIASFERDGNLIAKSFGASHAAGQWRFERRNVTPEHVA